MDEWEKDLQKDLQDPEFALHYYKGQHGLNEIIIKQYQLQVKDLEADLLEARKLYSEAAEKIKQLEFDYGFCLAHRDELKVKLQKYEVALKKIINDATANPDDLTERKWAIRADNYRLIKSLLK